MSFFNIHDVVLGADEVFNSLVEFFRDHVFCGSQSFTFRVTNFNAFEFMELDDGARKEDDVLASLLERVKSDKKSVCGDLPLILGLLLVLKVSVFEFGADVQYDSESLVSFMSLIILDMSEDCLGWNGFTASLDDSIADFSYKDN